MLCLRRCILTQRLCYPATYSASSLHRLLSAAAPAISPSPGFAVEDYLVDTCGLTRAQALKASAQLSHLDPPSNPNAVLAFLAGLGLSGADVAAAVAKDPRLLCAGVERTLVSNVAGLTALGMSRSEIARLVLLARGSFRCRSIVSRVQDNLLLFGSFEGLLRACKLNTNLLACKLERTVKPNVAILRECGLRACDITKLCIPVPWLLTSDVEHVRAMVASTEGIGVPRGSRMFRHALQAVAFFSEEKIAAKVEFLKKTFRWSDADVGIAVSKAPSVLRRSEEMLQRTSDFLILEVGLEPAYIARRPAMLSYSLDGRLRPRYFALKFLKANGLLDSHWGYYSVLVLTEKVFVEKYICPYKEAVPRLAEEYADTCKGPAPTKLRFTHGIKN